MAKDLQHILMLYMNVQRAAAKWARYNRVAYNELSAWECEDPATREAWRALTEPSNLMSLKEWLEAEKANGQSTLQTEVAIRHCEQRIRETSD